MGCTHALSHCRAAQGICPYTAAAPAFLRQAPPGQQASGPRQAACTPRDPPLPGSWGLESGGWQGGIQTDVGAVHQQVVACVLLQALIMVMEMPLAWRVVGPTQEACRRGCSHCNWGRLMRCAPFIASCESLCRSAWDASARPGRLVHEVEVPRIRISCCAVELY